MLLDSFYDLFFAVAFFHFEISIVSSFDRPPKKRSITRMKSGMILLSKGAIYEKETVFSGADFNHLHQINGDCRYLDFGGISFFIGFVLLATHVLHEHLVTKKFVN